MNRDELLKMIKSLNLPIGEYSVLSSGSLVIRGIYDKANDLDLHVTEKCFEYIKENYSVHFNDEKHEFNNPLYAFDDFDIDFFVMPLEDMHFDYVDGIPVQDIQEILDYKIKRNLPKDQEPINKIKLYLNTKKNEN